MIMEVAFCLNYSFKRLKGECNVEDKKAIRVQIKKIKCDFHILFNIAYGKQFFERDS